MMISKLLSKIRKVPDSLRLFFRLLLVRFFQNQNVQKIKSFIEKHSFEVISSELSQFWEAATAGILFTSDHEDKGTMLFIGLS